MATPTVEKVRTANLPQLQLTPKETAYLLSAVAFGNLVFGFLLGFLL